MGFFSAFITFSVIWWVVFLMSLPVGMQIIEAPEKGHAASAPRTPRIIQKMLWTTLITLLLTGIIAAFFNLGDHSWKTLLGAEGFSWPAYVPSPPSAQ